MSSEPPAYNSNTVSQLVLGYFCLMSFAISLPGKKFTFTSRWIQQQRNFWVLVISENNLPLDLFIPFHFKCEGLALANSQELTQLLTQSLPSFLPQGYGEKLVGMQVRKLLVK